MKTIIDVITKQITQSESVETKQDKILQKIKDRFGNIEVTARSDGLVVIEKHALTAKDLTDLQGDVNNA